MARADMLGYLQALVKDGVALPNTKEELSDDVGYETECNKMAYNQLILCCEGRAFSIVSNAKSEKHPRGDAALAWKNLKKRFQVETAAGKMELKLRFSSLKLRGGQDPDEWLLQLDLLRIRLDEMGGPVTDEDFVEKRKLFRYIACFMKYEEVHHTPNMKTVFELYSLVSQ